MNTDSLEDLPKQQLSS